MWKGAVSYVLNGGKGAVGYVEIYQIYLQLISEMSKIDLEWTWSWELSWSLTTTLRSTFDTGGFLGNRPDIKKSSEAFNISLLLTFFSFRSRKTFNVC